VLMWNRSASYSAFISSALRWRCRGVIRVRRELATGAGERQRIGILGEFRFPCDPDPSQGHHGLGSRRLPLSVYQVGLFCLVRNEVPLPALMVICAYLYIPSDCAAMRGWRKTCLLTCK
jgi:hypothetical protein